MSELGRPFLSHDLRQLIEAERHVADPPNTMKRRVAERVDRSLGLGGAMLAPRLGLEAPVVRDSSPPPLSPGLLSPPARLVGWKLVGASIGVVIAGAAALSLGALTSRANVVPRAAPRMDERTMTAPERPAIGAVSSRATDWFVPEGDSPPAAPIAAAHAPSRHRAAHAMAPVSVDSLAAERTVLDVARAALVRHDAVGALAALRSHAQAFPHGQLREERESMRVQALALAHDGAALRAAHDKFVRHFPRSMFLPAVEQAFEEAP